MNKEIEKMTPEELLTYWSDTSDLNAYDELLKRLSKNKAEFKEDKYLDGRGTMMSDKWYKDNGAGGRPNPDCGASGKSII